MNINEFNKQMDESVMANFYLKRDIKYNSNRTFWLVRSSKATRTDSLFLDILDVQEEVEWNAILPRIVDHYDKGVPPVPEDLIPADMWPSGCTVLDHMTVLSRFPDAWPVPTPQFWQNLREARTCPTTYLPEINIIELTVGVSTQEDVDQAIIALRQYAANSVRTTGLPFLPVIYESVPASLTELAYILSTTDNTELHIREDVKQSLDPALAEYIEGIYPTEADRSINLPVRAVLGDGLSFIMVIRFNCQHHKSGVVFFPPEDDTAPFLQLLDTVESQLNINQARESYVFRKMIRTFTRSYSSAGRHEMQITSLAALAGVETRLAADEDRVLYLATGIPSLTEGLQRPSSAKKFKDDNTLHQAFTLTTL